MYLASGGRLSYTLSVERVAVEQCAKRSSFVLKISDYFHAHVRKDTRLSPLFRTVSDGKLGGTWERAYTCAHELTSILDFAGLQTGMQIHLMHGRPF